MDIPKNQEIVAVAANMQPQNAAPKPFNPPGLEQEQARWPLRTVNDNTTASRYLTATSQVRVKASNDPRHFGHHSTNDRNFPATYHPPSRPRRGLDDHAFPRDPTARSLEEDLLARERRIRSYRDTTSEIISLYASRNSTTHNSDLARNDDDDSSGTLHSKFSSSHRPVHLNSTHFRNGSWQKSRTPGPYPTRLRRPGTSLASPTMAEARGRDYSRMTEGDRGPHYKIPEKRLAHNRYKASLANNQRRAPPLSLRAEMNRSSGSLPSRSSPGPNHYMTASGRARTPSSTVSWASRPSDRYYMGSTDQSSRSASLTSIVEMYQRPMTSSSTCPAMRPSGTLYYDYSEDFNDQNILNTRILEAPLSPVPHRVIGGIKPAILQQDLELNSHSAMCRSSLAHTAFRGGYNRTESSIESSFDSYLQGSHDDSIEEIERAIANAISNAAADKLVAASEHLNAYTDAMRNNITDSRSNLSNAGNTSRRLPATERQYGLKTSAPNMEMNIGSRRSSQLSLNKNAMALDPAFADFTSLLSSFERLAKSPFSRLSDEDDIDERHSRRSSKISTMETLDELEIAEHPKMKRPRGNITTGQAGTPALTAVESPTERPASPVDGTEPLTPEPLSPHRGKKGQNELRQRFMKALPPLPAEGIATHPGQVIHDSVDKRSKNDSAISQVRSLSLRSHISRSDSPGKLKLRVRTPSSFGDGDSVTASNGAPRERRSADECRATTNFKPPPKLKLKISRNQLGQGRATQTGSMIRNNRLKQCNALADVVQPPRSDLDKKTDYPTLTARQGGNERPEIMARGFDPRDSAGGSCQPSDQFNLSYPPTPVQSAPAILPRPRSSYQSVAEMQTVQTEAGEAVSHRIKPKFSFLRLRLVNQASPVTLMKPAPGPTYNNYESNEKAVEKATTCHNISQFDTTMTENLTSSVSVKSERVGNRVKRWATDAKRVVRSYVIRTLIRTPKSAGV
ncbi:hypothetical protein PWT90_06693 [Aphanocladium album]|nr:hypothetical protein PWT90_06693 [Aphanocladium album]